MHTWSTIRASHFGGKPNKFILTRDGDPVGKPFAIYQEGLAVGHTVLVTEASCCRQYGEADFLAVEKAVERATKALRSKAA